MSYDEKANVSIDADGMVLKCAKALAPAECGYVKGAEICAKCGATPVQMKMVPAAGVDAKAMMPMAEGEMPEEEEEVIPAKKPAAAPLMMEGDEEAEEDDEEMMDEDEKGMNMRMRKRKEIMPEGEEMEEAPEEEMMDDEEEKMMSRRTRRRKAMGPNAEMEVEEEETALEDEEATEDEEEAAAEEETGEEEEEEDDEEMMMGEKSFSPSDPEWEEVRRMRIKSMGLKPSDMGAFGYVCVIERKAYAGSSPVCDDCPGGCVAEKGLPGILHAEGLAEKMFDGSVVDSGYSPAADMFVVDVQTKDGGVKEVFIDGTSAEIMGFHRLDISEFEQKSDFINYKLVDFTEAAEIAVKAIDGTVVAVEPDVFEGFDSYAVEIEGFDGKSYDVFVALDGEILGYDRYEQDEAEEIEAEAAELALKRAFSEERRMELAKDGMALPDGSYPIVNESDLRNAIQAFGRAKDKEAAKRHIMKRARALKLESLIPANWVAGAKEKSEETEDAEFLASLVEFQLLEETLEDNK